jgi:choline dehydrogenase-like flavoprotein
MRYDAVIVGSGAGGSVVAKRLAERGLAVCMIERGEDLEPPSAPDEAAMPRYTAGGAEPANLELGTDPEVERPFILEARVVGGGTAIFSGNMLRFHPSDFRRRSLLGDVAGAALADWPVTYQDLEPYYTELEQEMGVGGDATRNPFEPPRSRPFPRPEVMLDATDPLFDQAARRLGWHAYPSPSVITAASGRAACQRCGLCNGFMCPFRARWSGRSFVAAALACGKLTLETGATVTQILSDPARDAVSGVEYRDRQGITQRAEGRVVIVAANAVQTARLLLQSSARSGRPLANQSGLVGKNLMTHSHEAFFVVATLPEGPTTVHSSGHTFAIQDFYDARDHGIALATTLEPRALGAGHGFWARLAAQSPYAPSDELQRKQYLGRFSHALAVVTMVEDLPQPTNQVRLSPLRKDGFGMPLPCVEYAAHHWDVAAAQFAADKGQQLLEACGAKDGFRLPLRSPRYHALGTCRMGSDAATSVVDATGRVHELNNLYIADGSVFVTSAGVNPALTIQAVALRIADQVLSRLLRREIAA